MENCLIKRFNEVDLLRLLDLSKIGIPKFLGIISISNFRNLKLNSKISKFVGILISDFFVWVFRPVSRVGNYYCRLRRYLS